MGTSNFPAPVQPSAGVAVAQGETAASSVAARAKAEVEARALVAIGRPRNVDSFRLDLLNACRRSRFAAGAWYSKPVGDKPVQGLSIRFAEEAARHYGNLHIGAQVVFDSPDIRVIKVVATDLESNNTYDSDVTVQKVVERKFPKKGEEVLRSRTNSKGETVYVIRADDDQLLNKQAALISKARRQLILQHIPSDVSEEAAEIILVTRQSEVETDPLAVRKRMVDGFYRLGVTPEQLEEFLGHALDTVNKAELHYLGSIYTGMMEGESSWAEVMELKQKGSGEAKAAPAEPSKATTGTSKLADKLAEKKERVAPPKPNEQKAIPAYIAALIKREQSGEALVGSDAEELRQWRLDNG